MKHISSMDQYVRVWEYVKLIREAKDTATTLENLVMSESSHIPYSITETVKMDDKTKQAIMPNGDQRMAGMRVFELADDVLHKLIREMMYYNRLIIGQYVRLDYADCHLDQDLSETDDGHWGYIPKLDLPDETMDELLECIRIMREWYDSFTMILQDYANYQSYLSDLAEGKLGYNIVELLGNDDDNLDDEK